MKRRKYWRARLGMWLGGRDVGISSTAIVCVMLGGRVGERRCWPWDPEDLRRCVLLLRAVPHWRRRIGEMGRVSPEWRRLAMHWGELESLLVSELGRQLLDGAAPLTYARMQELIDVRSHRGGR